MDNHEHHIKKEETLVFKKKRAKTTVLFKPDKDDDWFVEVIQFETKSGKETSKSLILQSDVPVWRSIYLEEGWEQDFNEPNLVEKKKRKYTKKTRLDGTSE